MSNTLNSTKVTSPENKQETVAHFSIDTPSTPFVMKNVVSLADDYVFSCFVKSDSTGSFKIGDKQITTSNKWTEVKIPFTVDSNGNPDIAIYFTVNGQYYFYHTQVERGEVPTKWQPSPDDVDENIQSVSTTQQASIEAMPGKIMAQVAEQYATKTDFSNITQRADSISTTVARVNSKVNDGSEIISTINQTAEDVSINASKINLNGVVTANSNFKILKDGSMEANNGKFTGDIIDKNGKKIISTEGVRAQLVFFAGNMTQCWGKTPNSYIVGYYQSNGLYDYVKSDYFNIPYIISENFIIDKAYLDCYISCVHWTNDNIYGYPRNLKLYISPNYNYEFSFYGIGSTGRAVTGISLGTQITNCWEISDGTSTTYDASLSASKHTVNVKTTDLTDYLNNNKKGLIYIRHDGDDEMSTDWDNTSKGTEIVKKAEKYTGQISATLFVEGYFRQAS